MIDKLYNLKITQRDQKIIQKAQINNNIEKIDAEIMFTKNKINTATVDRMGSISDFSVLEMHKNTMRMHINTLQKQKDALVLDLEKVNEEIVVLQKESEQFSYILEEEKKEALKKALLAEEEASEEFMLSKWINK